MQQDGTDLALEQHSTTKTAPVKVTPDSTSYKKISRKQIALNKESLQISPVLSLS